MATRRQDAYTEELEWLRCPNTTRTMLLDARELVLFYKLHRTLMLDLGQCLGLIPDNVESPLEFAHLPPELRMAVRDAVADRPESIDVVADANPSAYSAEELAIVRTWRHQVRDKFVVLRDLQQHTVFLSTTPPIVAYGVVSLSQPFEDLIGPGRPALIETVLLPFQGKIVYDGLMSRYDVSFGSGLRKALDSDFKEATARHGIVTSLPLTSAPATARQSRSTRPSKPRTHERQAPLDAVLELLDTFCQAHLNEEYAALCHRLAEELGRRRPSPLLKGTPSVWACAIVRAIGGVNFLHDKSRTPYMRSADIDKHFGVGKRSGAAKLATIRELLGMHPLDPDWTLPSLLADNPMVWMIEVDGLIVDVRRAPRNLQEIAFKQGLIPYVPADRQQP